MREINPNQDLQNSGMVKKAMTKFDGAIKRQKAFWCGICGDWFSDKQCETAVTHPFKSKKGVGILTFGVCTKCAERRASGLDLVEAARNAVIERIGKMTAEGTGDQKDPRVRYVILEA